MAEGALRGVWSSAILYEIVFLSFCIALDRLRTVGAY